MISGFANLQQPLELLDFHVVHRPKKQGPFRVTDTAGRGCLFFPQGLV